MTAAALAYAEGGWLVFPCHTVDAAGVCSCKAGPGCSSPGKHPRLSGWQKGGTEVQIRAWGRTWPEANVGIVTGAASGLVVLDIDPDKGGDASLRAWITENGPLPETATAATGGGGLHFFFEHPGAPVQNSASTVIGPGVDIRADGGFVVAAPSLHASGRRYKWLNDDCAPAPLPPALLKALTEGKSPAPPPGDKTRPQARQASEMGLVITEGGRNETLFRRACAMRGEGDGAAEIEAKLLELNARQCSPPLDAAEVRKIAQSAATYSANRVA